MIWFEDIANHCPVENIARCPLYIESHMPRGLGCVDDLMRPCRVSRSEMDFNAAVIELARRGVAHPEMLEALNPIGGRQ